MPKPTGIIMDLDGTLIDSPLDFAAIRRDLGLATGAPILEAVALAPPEQRARMEKRLLEHEWKAVHSSVLFPGVDSFFQRLGLWGVKRAIFTRNSREIALHALAHHGLEAELVVGREDAPPKPDPAGLELICNRWGCPKEELLYLGDYLYDLEAGRRCGLATWLFVPEEMPAFAAGAAAVYRSYAELEEMLESRKA